MLNFKKYSIGFKGQVEWYFHRYGEGSCQHSYATSYCFDMKYDDYYCINENYMYTLRKGISNDEYRVYLFPMGDAKDTAELKKAVDNVIFDAKSFGKKVMFQSITENAQNLLKELYNDKFVIEERRDLFEYMYKYETLAVMEGSHFKAKRNEIRKFFKTYEGATVKKISSDDIVNIKKLYKLWIDEKTTRKENSQLVYEENALDRALNNYNDLGLEGIAIYYNNILIGFVFGTKLNEKVFDYMIEKADSSYTGIFKVLNNELAKICCVGYNYLNLEEDLGEEGLRNSKMMYHPDMLLKKYVAMEV